MNRAQAAHAWELTEIEVKKICDAMGIDADNIPEGTVPVYQPDKYYDKDPHRYYIYLLDVISNTHMEIKGIDKDVLETCVEQLKEKKLIALKRGADPDSLDYHDYLMSVDRAVYNDWYSAIEKQNLTIIEKILPFLTQKK